MANRVASSLNPYSGYSKPDSLKRQTATQQTRIHFSGEPVKAEKEDLLKEIVAFENKKNMSFWEQVGQRLKRFFQDIGNTFKRLFSHKEDFALDNSFENYKKKLMNLLKTPQVGQWLKELTIKTKADLKKYYLDSDKSSADKEVRYSMIINSMDALEKSGKLGMVVVSGLLDKLEPSLDTLLDLAKQTEPTKPEKPEKA